MSIIIHSERLKEIIIHKGRTGPGLKPGPGLTPGFSSYKNVSRYISIYKTNKAVIMRTRRF